LPQIFNILRGEMSFVGPRPHAVGSLAGDQLFWEIDSQYSHRHACKPGLTGLAQVRGFRGATHRREDLINRLQADLEYVNGWSVWRDISILLATVKVVAHRNAF
jgi:lipopolysaccharide/colanic/teichoic acid biosynthesis glycosyltransferase